MKTDVINQFVDAVEAGEFDATAELLADDVVFDATVPNWRYRVSGSEAVRAELGKWYNAPSTFEHLQRIPIENGEVVEWTRNWTEDGVPHSSHQLHRLQMRDGRIAVDTVWCGGRWPASLLAEMAEAATE